MLFGVDRAWGKNLLQWDEFKVRVPLESEHPGGYEFICFAYLFSAIMESRGQAPPHLF